MNDSGKPLDDKAGDLIPVSLTLLGLLQAVEGLKRIELFVDEMLAIASALFLATLLTTRLASKTPNPDSLPAKISQLSYDVGLVVLFAAALVLGLEMA